MNRWPSKGPTASWPVSQITWGKQRVWCTDWNSTSQEKDKEEGEEVERRKRERSFDRTRFEAARKGWPDPDKSLAPSSRASCCTCEHSFSEEHPTDLAQFGALLS